MTERMRDGEFDSLTAELEGQLTDPLVTWVHDTAFEADWRISELPKAEQPAASARTIAELNARWPHVGKIVRVSGRIKVPDGDHYATRTVVDHPLISRGFRSIQTETKETSDGQSTTMNRTYYEFETNIDNADRRRKVIAVALPESLDAIDLPYPSDELRIRRFLYDHPYDAAYLDELAFKAKRDDQVLLDFGQYYFESDIATRPSDVESIQDASAFLRHRAELEPHASYYLAFSNDIIIVNKEGDGVPVTLKRQYTGAAHIRDITLRPADTSVYDLTTGTHCLVPFIDVIYFDAHDRTKDRQLLIPCSSLLGIRSTRYSANIE